MAKQFSLIETDPYKTIYDILAELRELFHSEGRIGDSNAKLEEVVKFIAINIAIKKGFVNANTKALFDANGLISINRLQELFRKIATHPLFKRQDGISIFGQNPFLVLQPGDEPIATKLFELSKTAIEYHSKNSGEIPFDILNESFGHFIRDTFRSHVEDAQYMTPPEVVDLMVSMAIHDIASDFKMGVRNTKEPFIMMDPSCGVGSFIAAFHHVYRHKKLSSWPEFYTVGQDKVDRMVLLSFMNMLLLDHSKDKIFLGNTLVDDSPIVAYDGKVDLILTNPPFGAKFSRSYIVGNSRNSLPIFSSASLTTKTYDSEILFIDRYLSLLRDGGRCLVVVPDGVISAKGVAAFLRQEITRRSVLKAVVELPSVTFAQAGTRTKTAILCFQKIKPQKRMPYQVFMAEASEVGFEVSKRKGVPIKKYIGQNQLLSIQEAYANSAKHFQANG